MIQLTIGGQTHELSTDDAKQLALAIASEVDRPGQAQRFRGTDTAFTVQSGSGISGQYGTQSFSCTGTFLTNC